MNNARDFVNHLRTEAAVESLRQTIRKWEVLAYGIEALSDETQRSDAAFTHSTLQGMLRDWLSNHAT